MNVDPHQNDDRVQNDHHALDDDGLCLVQGGATLVDVAKFVLKTLNDVLRTGSGRPQV
ncbi:hypothetical protein JQ634_29365 [Bradyrhizobium sp. AUGA SZCCT0240]|jgi:hypothetical protein|uniref:hypothetical protein n=1 Tax=unclassified Bradyrhizobium TaxID=2631580 RepID=UPI001BA5E1A6|nr:MULTISPECIES: hypothetical protein [unclassified Bradyrhizobium]MBR1190611.1 hypothetical protein [Bradyrhizobium sp. AUGA SZCCT0160]MBR1199444.1 hypothetical protein [Bradyrhizobium sp. AUGA SZCCT0158]MBR1249330.1 hypothetical protein [Bradyrhizobium sp. AUGA SZCCT0169]MBR1257783.1 hypothetical protein [Bradyrhizobium sp. AUGA SZCCT0240]